MVNDKDYFVISTDFDVYLAHGEKWDVAEKTRRGTTSTVVALNKNELPPYSNRNSSRSRSSQKRRSFGRWKNDILRSRVNANEANNPTV